MIFMGFFNFVILLFLCGYFRFQLWFGLSSSRSIGRVQPGLRTKLIKIGVWSSQLWMESNDKAMYYLLCG